MAEVNRGLRALSSILAVIVLTACAGGEPEPPDQYFRLVAKAPAPLSTPSLPGILLVKRFSADGLVAQRPVVYAKRNAPQALYQYNYHFWADAPTVMVQELVARALRESRVAEQVVTPAHGVVAEYVVVGRIGRFEHLVGDEPAVVIALELGVVHAGQRELIWLRDYSEEVAVSAPGVGPAVEVMNDALTRILTRFVSDLAAL